MVRQVLHMPGLAAGLANKYNTKRLAQCLWTHESSGSSYYLGWYMVHAHFAQRRNRVASRHPPKQEEMFDG